MKMKRLLSLLLALCLAGGVLTGCNDDDVSNPNNLDDIPKTDYNPLTGYKKDENYPADTRPTAVMVGNTKEALPQSGLSSADIIYEMVTEGGVTRLMAVFTDYTSMPLVGPVRSARDQFLQFAIPMNATFVHIGSSKYARDMLNYYSYKDIDGWYLGSTAFYFDTERAKSRNHEHCWYTNWEMLAAGISETQFNTTGSCLPVFNFTDPDGSKVVPAGGGAYGVQLRLSGTTETSFVYDAQTGTYLKSEYGIPQMDGLNNTQLAFDNLFILGTNITLKDDGLCTDFDFSEGVGYYISNGRYEKVQWKKGDATDQLVITSDGRKEISVNCGKSYVTFVSNTYLANITIDTEDPNATTSDSSDAGNA